MPRGGRLSAFIQGDQLPLPAQRRQQRTDQQHDRQQAETLTGAERPELAGLMEVYQVQLLRKAQALRESVRRGLRAL